MSDGGSHVVTRTVLCEKTATGGSKRVRAVRSDLPGAANTDEMEQHSFEEFYQSHYDAISLSRSKGLKNLPAPS